MIIWELGNRFVISFVCTILNFGRELDPLWYRIYGDTIKTNDDGTDGKNEETIDLGPKATPEQNEVY